MTVPRWDAQQWHNKQTATPARGPRMKAAAVAAVALCLGAAAVSATAFGDDEIGICHATGSAQEPYVFLMVDKDGYEHGHHRHHHGDFFVAPSAGGCAGDEYVEAVENGTTDNGTAGPATNATDDAPAETAADTAADPADNATAPGNATAEPTDNSTAEPANQTADAWVRQGAAQEGDVVTLVLSVGNGGDADATSVELFDSLPDVKRTWHLGGADAGACVLEDRELSCWFGQLAPGGTRQVELRSYTDRMPCGFSLTNTAEVGSDEDAQERNNASSASILARAC